MPIKFPDKYDQKSTERKFCQKWQEDRIYQWRDDLPKEQTFVIDTPPPTVSGLLHMGHVFSYTQADFVARFWRMQGRDVFYPMGFDDNGLPTERLVEKIVGKKAAIFESENGAGSFVNKCREVVEEAEKEFEDLFNKIALSVDWSQKYQTISSESQKISQASFVDLFNKGLVEKRLAPTFWDISDRTALAQADLIDKEVDGAMHEIDFAIEDNSEPLSIMTTRPELLAACVAVMVNPQDSRFSYLIKKQLNQEGEGVTGSYAITPLFGVRVPIIADSLVQMDKGTGAVMCCTFGDETDIKWWRKHNLPTRIILDEGGKCESISSENETSKEIIINKNNDQSFIIKHEELQDKNLFLENYQNLIANKKLKEVRNEVVKALELKPTPIRHAVKCAERSGVPIEIITKPQWFVKILPFKEQLKKKARECSWYPDYMLVRIEQWIEGLSWDWCISRQRFFGVKFPVWYSLKKGEFGKILLPKLNQLPVDPQLDLPHGYMRDEVLAETDIMDTWATSSITPQLSSKGISAEIYFDKARHEKLFPADIRPQAHEIIRSWAFYTIAKAMLHEDKIPWKNLMISGWCLSADKSKMSKSKGNVVTPTATIEEKSADIVRYWASASNLGADIAYSEEVFKIGQKLVTKLFNSAKFASMQFDKVINFNESELKELVNQTADVWILTRLEQVVLEYEKQFKIFEYARAREVLEDFFWKDYCDNYLEICKVRSYGLGAEKFAGIKLNEQQKQAIINQQLSAISALKLSLNAILKLFAPFVPFICEELYSAIYFDEYRNTKSVHARNNCAKTKYNFENEVFEYSSKLGKLMLEIIFEVRKFKSEKSLSMKSEIDSIIINKEKLIEFNLNDFTTLVSDENLIDNLSNQSSINFNSNDIKQNLLNSFLNDLKNVCNTKSIVFSDNIILSKNSLLTQIS